MKNRLSYNTMGICTIVSGIVGILAFAMLILSLFVREQSMEESNFVAKFHDAGVIIQFLLLIPLAFAFYKLSHVSHQAMSRTMLNIGIGTLCFTVVFLLLQFPNILAIVLYMFPQGLFGAWLVVMCWRMKGIFPSALRWFGIVVGVGLVLAGIFPLGYAIFVDRIILRIPAASDEEVAKIPTDTIATVILHQLLSIGTLLGVVTLPVWTILMGARLRRRGNEITSTSKN